MPIAAAKLADALICHKAGNLRGAEAIYRSLLQDDPENAEALRLLGILAAEIGKPMVGVRLISMAIERTPRNPIAYNNLGNALKAAGHLDQASDSYKAAIAFDPDYADAHFNLGNVQRLQKNFSAAIASYERAIALSPKEPDAHNNLGATLLEAGKEVQAAEAFRYALVLNPCYAEAHFNLGNALAASGDHPAAILCFDAALRLNADHAKAHLNRGASLTASGDVASAIAGFEAAIRLNPTYAAAHNNLGMALLELGDAEKAASSFRHAIELDPAYAEAHFNLGNALGALHQADPQKTIECFNQSIRIRPNYVKAFQNRGVSQESLGDLAAAAASYREALACDAGCTDALSNLGQVLALEGDPQGIAYLEEIVEDEPESPRAHWNLAVALLLHGDYARGWREYEWRWRCKEWPPRPFVQPQWKGDDIAGQTILIHAEQGIGDMLQMSRYLPLVAARGGRVVLEAHPSLRRLFGEFPGGCSFVEQGSPLPRFDCHCPVMSLPLAFATTTETIPAPVPFIPHGTGLPDAAELITVGLVWSGNPDHPRDRLRSCELREFAALLNVPAVSFISLQKGAAAAQVHDGHIPFFHPEKIQSAVDFADTAAIIRSLDLVITVDTAVAHLAASLGKPVWLLLSNLPDWRWGLDTKTDTKTTPWYPTARLFRRKFPDGWAAVMQEVSTALIGFVASHPRPTPIRPMPVADVSAFYLAAQKRRQAGDLPSAENLCRRVLAGHPEHADTLHLLGLVAIDLSQPLVAIQLISMAIQHCPREARYYNDLGTALRTGGHLKEAEASLRAAIAFHPAYAEAHVNLGNLLRSQEDFNAAADCYQDAINREDPKAWSSFGRNLQDMGLKQRAVEAFLRAAELSPTYSDAFFNLGNAFAAQDNHPKAVDYYREVIELQPGHAAARLCRGISLAALGNLSAAVQDFEQSVVLTPNDPAAHNNLGAILIDLQRHCEAIQPLRRAIELSPAYADAHFNLANAFAAEGDHLGAIEAFNRAIQLRPRYKKAFQNRGASYESLGELEAAACSYRAALALEPGCRDNRSNLGQVLALQGDPQGIVLLEQIVDEYPASAEAHVNLAHALLLHRQYRRGWREYEWRWQWQGSTPARPFDRPEWDGGSLRDKTILLHAEQGLGDTIQFVRYVALVAGQGGRIVLEVQPELYRLLSDLPGVDRLVRQRDLLPDFSCHCPLLSLPGKFGTDFASIPATMPYPCSHPGPISCKEASPALLKQLSIGLVWAGSPLHPRDRLRSLHFNELLPLFETKDCTFVSLQKGQPALQMRECGVALAEPCHAARDLLDTAGVIATLDLVITVDTAVAHLAGTMGKPVWILLSNCPDWRWGLDSDQTPWYPTARLFRRSTPGGWSSVVEDIRHALQRFSAAPQPISPTLSHRGHPNPAAGRSAATDWAQSMAP